MLKYLLILLGYVIIYYIGKFVIKNLIIIYGKLQAKRIEDCSPKSHVRKVKRTYTGLILTIYKIIMILILISVIMAASGISILDFIRTLGFLTFIISMLISPIIINLVRSLVLVYGSDLEVGSIIEIHNEIGTVREFHPFYTKIEMEDGSYMMVINSEMNVYRIINAEDLEKRKKERKKIMFLRK